MQEIDQLESASDGERIAIAVMGERLSSSIDMYDAGEHECDLSVLRSAHGSIRQAFDLMPLGSDDDWEVARQRLAAVPAALDGVRASLAAGLASGRSAARRPEMARLAPRRC